MNQKQLKKLKSTIVADTKANGFSLAKPSEVAELQASGHVEVNTAATPDANGNVPVRSTEKLNAEFSADAAPAEVTSKPVFEITSNVPVIAGQRGGVKEEVYPFSKLEVGQSFVVPVSADRPNPKDVVEKFSSTVSSATRRYAEPSATLTRTTKDGKTTAKMVPTRKFTLRPVTQGQTYPGSTFVEPVSGARVYRTA